MNKRLMWMLLLVPMMLFAGGNPGNPLREFTVEDSVRWVLSGLEFAYNAGLAEEVLSRFSTNYRDRNDVSYNSLGTMLPNLLDNVQESNNRFLMYNASVEVDGNQAVLTGSFMIQPEGRDDNSPLIAKDTIVLNRVGDTWLISSAPRLTTRIAEAYAIRNSLPVRNTDPDPAEVGNEFQPYQDVNPDPAREEPAVEEEIETQPIEGGYGAE